MSFVATRFDKSRCVAAMIRAAGSHRVAADGRDHMLLQSPEDLCLHRKRCAPISRETVPFSGVSERAGERSLVAPVERALTCETVRFDQAAGRQPQLTAMNGLSFRRRRDRAGNGPPILACRSRQG